MDPIVAQVMAVLATVATEQGTKLLTEASEAAIGAARRLVGAVLDRFKGDDAGKVIAAGYEKNPEVYKAPVADELKRRLEEDPAFAAEIEALLAEVRQATPPETYRIVVGSGNLAMDGSAIATNGGAAAAGGSTAWVSPTPPPSTAPPGPPAKD